MKLYHYDHCPYCVKARMIFGFKNIPFELEALPNDDEETPIGLTGKKMLPILIKDNGNALPESLDIIDYLDNLVTYGGSIVEPSHNNSFLTNWLTEARNYHYFLAMPRWIKGGLEEFSSQSAQDYFEVRKTQYIGPFSQAIDETDKYIAMAHEHFKALDELDLSANFLWGQLSYDDFHLFATLRCLTIAKDVRFSPDMQAYTEFISEKSKVPLHWDSAL